MEAATPAARELLTGVAVLLFAAAGVLAWISARRRMQSGPTLAGIGPLSRATRYVIALVSLAFAYHIAAAGFDWRTLRAPLWLALLVGLIAVAASLALDAMEGRPGGREGEAGGIEDERER
jgi:hypothetical protein